MRAGAFSIASDGTQGSAGQLPDWFEEAMVIEPRHPFERGELHRFEGFPGGAPTVFVNKDVYGVDEVASDKGSGLTRSGLSHASVGKSRLRMFCDQRPGCGARASWSICLRFATLVGASPR